MNSEEILKAAQENPQEVGEFEKSITRKAINRGIIWGIILCLCLMAIEFFVDGHIDYGKAAVIAMMHGVASLYEGRAIKNKKMIVTGIIDCLFLFICILLFFGAFLV